MEKKDSEELRSKLLIPNNLLAIEELFPYNQLSQYHKQSGKLEFDTTTRLKKGFLWGETVAAPEYQPNYNKTDLLDKM